MTNTDIIIFVPDAVFREELGGLSYMSIRRRDQNPPPHWPVPIKTGDKKNSRHFRARADIDAYKAELLKQALTIQDQRKSRKKKTSHKFKLRTAEIKMQNTLYQSLIQKVQNTTTAARTKDNPYATDEDINDIIQLLMVYIEKPHTKIPNQIAHYALAALIELKARIADLKNSPTQLQLVKSHGG